MSGIDLRAATVSHDGSFVVAASDLFVVQWSVATDQRRHMISLQSMFKAFDLTPDGTRIAIAQSNGVTSIFALQLERPRLMQQVHESPGLVRRIALRDDGKTVATCGYDNVSRVWDVGTGAFLGSIPGSPGHLAGCGFDSRHRFVTISDRAGEHGVEREGRVWDLEPMPLLDTTYARWAVVRTGTIPDPAVMGGVRAVSVP